MRQLQVHWSELIITLSQRPGANHQQHPTSSQWGGLSDFSRHKPCLQFRNCLSVVVSVQEWPVWDPYSISDNILSRAKLSGSHNHLFFFSFRPLWAEGLINETVFIKWNTRIMFRGLCQFSAWQDNRLPQSQRLWDILPSMQGHTLTHRLPQTW